MINTEIALYLHKALSGDPIATRKLFELLYSPISTFFTKKGLNDEASKDLTQESLLGIYKSLERYDQERSFLSWSFSICHYKYIDFLRSKYSKNIFSEFSDQLIFLESFYTNIETRDLLNHLTKDLNKLEKDILLRSKYKGEKINDIALSLNKKNGAVKMILSRTIKKIKLSNRDLQ